VGIHAKRALAIVAAVVALAAPAAWFATSAQPDAVRVVSSSDGRVTSVVSFPFDGKTRSYRLFVPPAPTGTRRALLVALHPLGSTGAKFERGSGLDRRAAAAGAIVVYPDGLGRSWDAGTCCGYAVRHQVDDVRFLVRVVADVSRRLPVALARVAVAGFSNGALMSYRLACERPDVFHVAAAVAGDDVGSRCNPARPVAVLHVHGARDPLIPLSGVATSPLDRDGFPPAAASIEHVAVADGCTGAATGALSFGTDWSATGCDNNETVELITSTAMGHHYPTGAADRARYGLDMSVLTWSFVQAAWAAG
jgi:polyhydroxybutyrate depolymerase